MKFDHIVFITQDFPPGAGGIQTWCVQLAKQFADRGIRISIITKSFDDFSAEPFLYKNVEVIRLPHEKWGRKKNILCYKALKEVITPSSIVLASNWKMGVPALLSHIFNGTQYFAVCHGLDAFESRWKNRYLQHLVFKKANMSIAVSNFTKNYMVQNNIKSDIIVINNGVEDTKYFKTEVPTYIYDKYRFDKSKLNIINMGRLIERKGFDYTILAIADLPDVVFHIAGTGHLEDYLRELADKYKVSDRVYFHGFIPDDEVNYLFNMADLFVMPSRKVDNSVEGFGITYLEAASAETPSIGSLGTGAEDAIEDGKSGLLVDGESIESIRNGIRYFTKKPEALGTMGKYAAQRVQQFTWGNVANEFINTFEKYLS